MYEDDSSKIIDVVDEKDETDEQENMITNSTFINPSQFDQSCSVFNFQDSGKVKEPFKRFT